MAAQKTVILILEDNTNMRRGIALTLEMNDYEVHQVSNGHQGMAMMSEITPDLILSDVNMPLMNGLKFYEKIRENPTWRKIPFIFLTGNDALDRAFLRQYLNIEEYLQKPINPKDLLHLIKTKLH